MKTLNLKRIASTALAGVMALSLAVPTFAADDNTTTVTGVYKQITLSVTVPDTGDAVINPLGLPCEIKSGSVTKEVTGEQIVTTTPLVLQNKSSVDLDVAAKVTVTPGTGIYVVNDLTKAQAKDDTITAKLKLLKVDLEVFANELDNTSVSSDQTKVDEFAALKSSEADLTIITGLVRTSTKTSGPVTGQGGGDGSVILKKGNNGNLQKGGAAYFRLAGVAASGGTVWNGTGDNADKITAAIAWTFTPFVRENAGTLVATKDGTDPLDTENQLGVVTGPASSGQDTGVVTLALPSGVNTVSEVVWTSSDETVVKVEDAAGDANNVLKANITNVATTVTSGGGSPLTADITVTFKGSNGTFYESSPLTITVVADAQG